MNHELPNVQAGFRKGRGTRDQIANIRWIMEKAREFQKNIYFCFIDNAKAFDCVDHNKLWKILRELGIPDHLTCLLRNLYVKKHCLFLLLPSIFPSNRVFSNESALRIRWPKYQSFSFSINPSKDCSGSISFRIDWFDLFAVQGTLKSLQHHSSKASILQYSALFMVQLSHPYMTTGKTIALTRWTFVSKVMSLLLNMLSRLVITSIPRSKHLLISWLQSPFAVILEPPQNKVCHCFPIYLP